MKKRVLSVFLAGVMTLGLLAGCGSSEGGDAAADEGSASTEESAEESTEGAAEEAGAEKEDGEYTIAVVGKQEASEWWQIFIDGVNRAGEELGVNAYYRSPEKETDIQDQVNICQDCITQGIDALVLSAADPTALNDIILQCNEADIPVVLVNDTIDDAALEAAGGYYETYVGIVQYNAASLAGQYVVDNYEPCKIGIVEGVPGVAAHEDRLNGFKDVVEEAGFEVVASQTANCDTNEAFDVTTNMLTANPDIEVIWTTNAEMGLGIVQAIENMGLVAGKDGISVFDFDCSSDDKANIAAGTLVGTIDQNQSEMAYTAVETALKAIQGEEFDGVGSQIETSAIIVTEENIADYQ
ncbi:MAG: sugar ABC transporter substrate-binding protein [Ruminococcus sp.]|jgi:ribose transport system substrate-binding protein